MRLTLCLFLGALGGLAVAAPTLSSATGSSVQPGAETASGAVLYNLRSGGIRRWYRVHYPPTFQDDVPTAVVLGFHGGGGNARQFMDQSGLNVASDLHGFVVVYPEGTGVLGGWPLFTLETWNSGDCCGYAAANNIDDVLFTRDLLQDLGQRMTIDADAVFATGHSNGGMMSYRLALQAPDLFAAVAPNAACKDLAMQPQLPIPLIAFHGKLDCNIPSQGGIGCGPSGTYKRSQEDSLRPFLRVNRAQVPTQPAERRGQALRYEADAPQTGADVHYWWMRDHGHAWPGHGSALPGEPCNDDIDINEEIWVFFDAHRR